MTNFQHRFRISLHDTDAAGVMFFAHLLRHAHDAYEGLMTQLGWPIDALIRERRLALPLAHAEADYHRPLRHGDQVDCAAQVTAVGNRTFTLHYRFSAADGQLAATAGTVHVAVDPDHAPDGPVALPAALAAALRGAAPTPGSAATAR